MARGSYKFPGVRNFVGQRTGDLGRPIIPWWTHDPMVDALSYGGPMACSKRDTSEAERPPRDGLWVGSDSKDASVEENGVGGRALGVAGALPAEAGNSSCSKGRSLNSVKDPGYSMEANERSLTQARQRRRRSSQKALGPRRLCVSGARLPWERRPEFAAPPGVPSLCASSSSLPQPLRSRRKCLGQAAVAGQKVFLIICTRVPWVRCPPKGTGGPQTAGVCSPLAPALLPLPGRGGSAKTGKTSTPPPNDLPWRISAIKELTLAKGKPETLLRETKVCVNCSFRQLQEALFSFQVRIPTARCFRAFAILIWLFPEIPSLSCDVKSMTLILITD
ncbi:uncharacterized protein LOC111559816 [Felis catus]|uniref:uncharacterized protein LOC111559816 n=1 Tax=Felis catus TaxID=9685 RepID=UPI001D19A0B3|nr:uncharacterized protein LOC111559816 [Felis catus]